MAVNLRGRRRWGEGRGGRVGSRAPLPSAPVRRQHISMLPTALEAPSTPTPAAPPMPPLPAATPTPTLSPTPAVTSTSAPGAPAPLLRPPALQRGDTIGVAALSYAPRPGLLARGVQALERAGYGVVLDKEIARARLPRPHGGRPASLPPRPVHRVLPLVADHAAAGDADRPRGHARRAPGAGDGRQPLARAADGGHALRDRHARRDPLPRGGARAHELRGRAPRPPARGG